MQPSGIVLYHAATAVCAAKVRVVLAEKGLSYEGRMINLQAGDQFKPDYLALNPNAVVPTLVHDGEIVLESTVINEYLDEVFPKPALRPDTPLGRARLHVWTKKEDTIHDAINTMTATIVFRHDLMKKTPEERAQRYARMPDPAKREKWRRMMEEGLDSPLVTEALGRFAKHFRDMEKALAASPWLLGDSFSLADAGLLSFFYRLEMMHCAGLWTRHFPQVTRWYAAAKARESFRIGVLEPIPAAAYAAYDQASGPVWPDVERAWERAVG